MIGPRRGWSAGPVGLALGASAVAALAPTRVVARDDILSHFKYGSVGTEVSVGLPYPIWRVLPVLFADKLPNWPGQGYANFLTATARDPRFEVGTVLEAIRWRRVGFVSEGPAADRDALLEYLKTL